MAKSAGATPKPSLPDLRAFVTVGRLKSFAAAAEALHLSQPALSRRISGLTGGTGPLPEGQPT